MNKSDAAKILNLTGNITQEIIKAAYRKACFKYHPDRNPAGLEMMKVINQAYEALKSEADFSVDNDTEYDSKLNDAINDVINLDGVEIELCGVWVWLSGNTRQHKEIIKAAGFFWGSVKKKWYFRPADYKSKSRGKLDMDDIRDKHGSRILKKQIRKKIK